MVLKHGVLSEYDEAILGVFEGNILRAIFGPTNGNGECRIKYSNELYTLYKESDILTYIKINRLISAGHVIRMDEQSATRRVLVAVVEERTQRGRRKLKMGRWCGGRWCDGRCQEVGEEKLEECCKE